jgi:hypothetical protein
VLAVMGMAANVLCGAEWVVAAEPKPIPVVAGFADHAALDVALQRRIREAVSAQLEAQDGGQVSWAVMPDEWRARGGRSVLTGLTPTECCQAKLDLGVQGLVLWIDYTKGSYAIACAVYHREFKDVIVSKTVAMVDRRLVVNNMQRLASRVWRPVGEIVEARGANLVVVLSGTGAGSASTLPSVGSPLEVLRVYTRRTVQKRQAWPGQFLVVREHQDPSTVVASGVDPGEQAPKFFRHVGEPEVRYHVRPMKPSRGPTRIRVVSDSDGRPREGCAVYVTDAKPPGVFPRGTPDGVTDEAGFFTVPFRGSGFRYVTVACGIRFKTVTVASVQGADPVVLKLSRHAPAEQKQAALERVRRRVRESEEWLRVSTEKANHLLLEKDEDEIDNTIMALSQYSHWESIRQEIDAIRRELGGPVTDKHRSRFEQLAADVQFELQRLSENRQECKKNIDVFTTSLRNIKSTRLGDEYDMARNMFNWNDAVAALEELTEVDPDRRESKELLSRLRRALKESSPEHARARRLARDGVRAETVADVLASWRDTVKAVGVLVREDDGPALWELLEGLAQSRMLLMDDIGVIARRIRVDGGDLEDDETKRLEDRLKLIRDALAGFVGASKDAKKLVREFRL